MSFRFLIVWLACGLSAGALAQASPRLRLVPQLGHGLPINAVVFSKDGRVLVTGSADRTIKFWDVATGDELLTIHSDTMPVTSVALSPDGKRLATSSADTAIQVWDIDTAKRLLKFSFGHFPAISVAFSPDGKTLATVGWDFYVKLWNAATGKAIRSIPAGHESLFQVAYSPDGAKLAAVGDSGVQVFDPASGRLITAFMGPSRRVQAVAFSPDGTLLAAGGDGPIAYIWDVRTFRKVGELAHPTGDVNGIAFSPDGRQVALAESDHSVGVWNIASAAETRTLLGHSSSVLAVAFSRDGRTLASAGADLTARLWDAATGEPLRTLAGHAGSVSAVAFSANGRLLATGGKDNVAKLWDLSLGRQVAVFAGHTDRINSVALSPNGKLLATGSDDKTAKLWDVDSRQLKASIDAGTFQVQAIAFSPDGRRLATGGIGGVLKLWDVDTGKCVQTLFSKGPILGWIAFSPDGRAIICGGFQSKAEVWDLASGRLVRRIEATGNGALSPTGRLVATARDHLTIGDIASGRAVRSFPLNWAEVDCVAFSKDGRMVATGATDQTVRLWDAWGQRAPRVLYGHAGWVSGLAFSPDGGVLASGSDDGTVRLWNAATGTPLASLVSFDDGSWAVVDPKGRYDGSNAGDVERLHWVLGREPIDLGQFRDVYYTHDLLSAVWRRATLTPVPDIQDIGLYPRATAVIDGDTGTIEIGNRGGGIGRVRVLLNGQQVKEFNADPTRPDVRADAPTASLSVDLTGLPRLGSADRLSVLVSNSANSLRSRGSMAQSVALSTAPTRYFAIVAGIESYADSSLNLGFSAEDAVAMAKSLLLAAHGLDPAPSVHIYLLCDAQDAKAVAGPEVTVLEPNRAGFDRAFGAIQTQATGPNDLFLLYLSGHGVGFEQNGKHYGYLTMDAKSGNASDLAIESVRHEWAITDDDLIEYMKPVAARKRVMILDTCYAGALEASLVAMRAADQDPRVAALDLRDGTGFHLLLASAKDRVAYEAPEYRHGFLTYALLHELKNAELGDARSPDEVDVTHWFEETAKYTDELARSNHAYQQPVAPSIGGSSYAIGYLDRSARASITLAEALPKVGSALLVDKATSKVDMELSLAVSKAIRESLVTRGDAPAVYVEASDAPGVIRLSGYYSVVGGLLRVHVDAEREGKTIASFDVEGTRSELPAKVREGLFRLLRGV